MAFPLGLIGTGLSLGSSIAGIVMGNDAEERAQRAAQQAIQDFVNAGSEEYSQKEGSGIRGMYDLSGALGGALEKLGSNLGSATAAGGVYNSSATVGALAKQQETNAATLGRYSTNLTDILANMKGRTNQQAAGMRFDLYRNELNYAREQQAGGAEGISNFLGNLSQFNFGQMGATSMRPNNMGSVLPMPYQYRMTGRNPDMIPGAP